MSRKGKFITFEGSEGSGKSTQIEMIRRYLRRKKRKVLFLREPGTTKIGEDIRQILLDTGNARMGDACETLLYMGARAQLVDEVIAPALKKGTIVLCDRFLDSTVAYQGYGNGVNVDLIQTIGRFATQGIKPDLTLFFDIDVRKGLSRIRRKKDRIERRAVGYHDRVRRGYLKLARKEPRRIKVVKVDGKREDIHAVVRMYIDRLLGL